MPDPLALLFVDPDADRLAPEMEATDPRLRVTPCSSLAAARAHLSGTSFGIVLAAARLPDGRALRLSEIGVALPPLVLRTDTSEEAREAERAGAAMAFAAPADARLLAAVAAWKAGLASGAAPPAPAPEASGDEAEGPATVLVPVRDAIARVVHEINNPLAVISGNAQLARELLRAAPDDPSIPDSLRDIEAASETIAELMSEVSAARRQVEAAIAKAR